MSRELDRKTEAELLAAYLSGSPNRQPVVAAMQSLLVQPEAFSRNFCSPGHFTASAFVVNPRQTHVLLIHHKKLGCWLQPGGHIEPEDVSLHDAAIREAQEETGVLELCPLGSGVFDVDIHQIPARRDEAAHQHFDVRYAFVAGSEQLQVSEEVKAARWVALGEVAALNDEVSVTRPVLALHGLCSESDSG